MRAGPRVRLDLVLAPVAEPASGLRTTVEGPPDDLVALTDSATIALLDLAWRSGGPPARSLSDVTTRSVTALRAFVAGEEALARGQFAKAVEAYERAFREDSTFWFAYWRSLYPRQHTGAPPDSAALASAFAHRDRLPERERLLMEADLAGTLEERIVRLRRLTQRFPDYWPAWWELGEELVHRGPYVGTTYAETEATLSRLLELNPGFAPAWEHLFFISVLARDRGRAAAARERLETFVVPGSVRFNSDMLPYVRALDEVLSGGGEFGEAGALRVARTIRDLDEAAAPIRPEGLATGFVAFGFPRAQLQLADALESVGAEGELAAFLSWGRALAYAIRGAWDSALVHSERWARATEDPSAGLRGYGLAVVGAWLGEVSPEAAEAHRAPASRFAERGTDADRAELAWLDGILAHTRGDTPALQRAIDRIGTGGGPGAAKLRRSLEAFRLEAAGELATAAERLATLEEETSAGLSSRYRANQRDPAHPSLSAVNRLAAGRWLLGAGDTLRAMRLLVWHEAIGPIDQEEQMNRVVEPLALLEQARIAESRGERVAASSYYAAFLERYDMPAPPQTALVEDALRAHRRLSDQPPP